MKKLLSALCLCLVVSATAFARNSYSRDASSLPSAAQAILSQNFKAPVSLIKIDRTLGSATEYDVILTDGTEVQFDRNGDWEGVETNPNQAVPSSFILSPIADYVTKSFGGNYITGIEKSRRGYEVELSNGADLRFDRRGVFLGYDD